MEVKENRPDACTASGTADSIYKDFSTDAPDIQEELRVIGQNVCPQSYAFPR